jgi:hypothetical protein
MVFSTVQISMPGTSCARSGAIASVASSNITTQALAFRNGMQVPRQNDHGNVRFLRAAAEGYHTRTAFSR